MDKYNKDKVWFNNIYYLKVNDWMCIVNKQIRVGILRLNKFINTKYWDSDGEEGKLS